MLVDCQVPSMGLAATLAKEPTTLNKFKELADVFLADKARKLLTHGPQDLVIELQDEKQPPWGPIYNLSDKELTVLREYIKTNMEHG